MTPNYSVSLLASCLRREGFEVVLPELEINFFNHVDDEEKKLWMPVNGHEWDDNKVPDALFEKYKEGFLDTLC